MLYGQSTSAGSCGHFKFHTKRDATRGSLPRENRQADQGGELGCNLQERTGDGAADRRDGLSSSTKSGGFWRNDPMHHNLSRRCTFIERGRLIAASAIPGYPSNLAVRAYSPSSGRHHYVCTSALAALLLACSSDSGQQETGIQIGGTIRNLRLDGLVLQCRDQFVSVPAAATRFTFQHRVPVGAENPVQIVSAPPGQLCRITQRLGPF